MGKKRKTKKTKNLKKNTKKTIIQDEVILMISLLVSVLLILSYFDLSGKVGKVVSGFIFGLVGLFAYALPFVLFFGVAFYLSNRGNKIAKRRLISLLIFLFAFTAFLELFSHGYSSTTKITDYYNKSADLRKGGGIIGGLQVMLLCSLFDKIATYVILVGTMVTTAMIITGKAIFTGIKRISGKFIDNQKVALKVRQENREKYEDQIVSDTAYEEEKRRPAKTFDLNPDDFQTSIQLQEDIVLDNKKKKAKRKKTVKAKQENKPNNPSYIEEELAIKFGISDSNKDLEEESKEITINETNEIDKTIELDQTSEFDKIEINNIYNHKEDKVDLAENTKKKSPVSKVVKTPSVSDGVKIDLTDSEEKYIFPSLDLLTKPIKKTKGIDDASLKATAYKLQETLKSFGVDVTITNISCGPSVTRYEIQPEQGVKVSKITSLADDIKLNLAASDIRIEAPIPGKAAVGIEVPNNENTIVSMRNMLEGDEFKSHKSQIAFTVGKDIGGKNVIADIGKMPHLLIAGATGSGKSVCINTLIMSILFKARPSDVRLIMIDPKVVELSVYNGIPHLLIPVVTDPKKASSALFWAVAEMTERYKKFADVGARDLQGYNSIIKKDEYKDNEEHIRMPQIVIIIDELADLMMVAPGEVEDAICRLAQMARAAGIHLIIATQRPSVNVITGLIKANIPSRIAFSVSSAIDSRTIIDSGGAEKLLGKGDMLFYPAGYSKPIRVQGTFVSDKEVSKTVDFVKKNNEKTSYNEEINEKISNPEPMGSYGEPAERDEYFLEAGKFVIEKDKGSIGMLQRIYRIGFNRAARMMDQLADAGVVGPENGTKPREVLMTSEEFDQWMEENNED